MTWGCAEGSRSEHITFTFMCGDHYQTADTTRVIVGAIRLQAHLRVPSSSACLFINAHLPIPFTESLPAAFCSFSVAKKKKDYVIAQQDRVRDFLTCRSTGMPYSGHATMSPPVL